jgi:type IV pilus assembly protein PilY1
MMWQFDSSDHPAMGQSWSAPVRATVNFGSSDSPNPKDVLIFGGGYDTAQDSKTTYSDDSVGNAVFMVDARSGALLWSASDANASLVLADMDSAIPAGVRPIDLDLDGMIDRMYAVDIAGRLWRFDVHTEQSFEITGGVIAELGGTVNNNQANNRRFYYAPDVALGRDAGYAFLTVTLGSGYRAKPLDSGIDDYLFGIRDYKAFEVLGDDTDDYDYGVTIGDLTTMSSTSTTTVPAGGPGWKYPLTDSGEKVLARSRIFQNTAYFTTYKPGSAPASNPCAPAVGSGALYTIDLNTGQVVRDPLQKPGIPPEPTFIFGAPPEDDWELDNCYGPHCDNPNPEPETCAENDPDCEPYEETRPNTRPIECLAGPEMCGGGGTERPVRTYWRQLDQGD